MNKFHNMKYIPYYRIKKTGKKMSKPPGLLTAYHKMGIFQALLPKKGKTKENY